MSDAALEGHILAWRCSEESRGLMLYRLASDQKLWLAFFKALQIETMDELRTALLVPMKKV